MKTKLLKTVSAALIIILTLCIKLSASGFIGIGSGANFSGSTSEEDNKFRSGAGIPFILEYQYSPEYRDSWMFNSSFSYIPAINDDSPGNVMVYTAGIMYIKPFTYYRSNITQNTMQNNRCMGVLLLPFTVMTDTLNNLFQFIIPQHPEGFADFALIKEQDEPLKPGFSAGAGLSGGGIDIRLRYTQNLRYSGGLRRDIYTAGIEFTFNIPLQEKFMKMENLIE